MCSRGGGSKPVSSGDPESSSAAVGEEKDGDVVSSGDQTTNPDSEEEKADRIVNNVLWEVRSKIKGQEYTTINRYHTNVYNLGKFKVALVVLPKTAKEIQLLKEDKKLLDAKPNVS